MKKADSKIPKDWLNRANHDISDANLLFRDGGYADTVCFLCHQAVEKYLKGYLLAKGIEYPRIHNLPELLDLCVEMNGEFVDFIDNTKYLNQFYIESRYPIDPPCLPSKKETKQAIEATEEIIGFIQRAVK